MCNSFTVALFGVTMLQRFYRGKQIKRTKRLPGNRVKIIYVGPKGRPGPDEVVSLSAYLAGCKKVEASKS